eukprot:NODE_817_length_1172_cov_124.899522_g775_i0.p1 GENE.NODE_817_length_1172_cov_124.899522_g775_i0~~NODE_817_length_1172_cov_124.899522_g775_i0.p1  ORF type:complete len:306 (+),score=45.96 NODE_817_length_1172_cov_124.899522_g775_i0:63-980(+)
MRRLSIQSQELSVQQVLAQLKKSGRAVITIHPNQTLKVALSTLAQHNILAAPIVSDNNEFKGIVDMMDLVAVLATSAQTDDGDLTKAQAVLEKNISEIIPILREHKQQDVGFLAEGIGTRTLIKDVVHNFFLPHRTHRLAINDCDAMLQQILTQTDVIRFLAANPHYRAEVRSHTLTSAGLGAPVQSLVTVSTETTVLQALLEMLNKGVRCVPVLGDGKLVESFSAKSLRGFDGGSLQQLKMSVQEFNARLKAGETHPITFTPESTVGEVIMGLATKNTHYGFVVDTSGHPIRVVSISDVLAALF